jgi:hypothetical protein
MRVEVHVHGTVLLKSGTTSTQLEAALRPWLEYIDEDSLSDAKSAHLDEPGIVFDRKRRVLDVCWTGDVGRSFRQILAESFDALNGFCEEAVAFDITYYHEDGRDEFDVMFVGPTADLIHEAQRARMMEDLQLLLTRQFSDTDAGQVLALVNELFERNWQAKKSAADAAAPDESTLPARKQLH